MFISRRYIINDFLKKINDKSIRNNFIQSFLRDEDNSCKSSLFVHNLRVAWCHNSNWWRDLSCFSPTLLQICRVDRVRTGADRTHLERTFYKLFYNPRIQRHTLRTRGPLPLLAIAAALLCPGHGFYFSTRFLRFETSSCRHLPFTTCSRLMDSFAHDFSFRFPSRMFVSRNLRNCARKVYICRFADEASCEWKRIVTKRG